ncbi:3-hydroxyacyl-CoA dehydrogenase family protein [Noviherbaspirillum sp. Root189]|uniref:3-hydroxyacyl-CoA dehydrogenase family protein n=1 Tax=Noviherbaspirillum sp. Root189 TaxID=1736487 RepID=UPI001F295BD7|nr:3-hydroxyacyl-CoA dehydrogenase family protein [Noviherbaspirillum sp. Root189]
MWREAFALVEAGVCDARTIDTVVKNSFGRRLSVLGPMENADLVGLELIRDVHRILFPHLCQNQSPSALLERLLGKGETGVGTGKGLFEWSEDSIEEVRSKLANHLIASAETATHPGETNE